MKKYFYILFLFLLHFTNAAQNCDTAIVSKQEHLAKQCKKYSRQIEKRKSVPYNKADLFFDISTYVRQQKDTTYKAWYNSTIDAYKKGLSGRCDKNSTFKNIYLYKMGLCYFYVEDFTNAETYLSKAIAAKYDTPCSQYYLSLSRQKQNKE